MGIKSILLAAATLVLSTSVNAAVILSPTAIINNNFGEYAPSTSQENMINQSGLSTGFISGVTDFDTYIAGNPTANCNNCAPQYFGVDGAYSGVIDFDLGGIFSVNQLALGNNDARGITSFEIFTSDSASFTGAVSVGVFSSTVSGDAQLNRPIEVFDLLDTNAQFVRLEVYSHATSILGISELAFDVAPPSSVPVPAAVWLFGSGLLGLVGLARRKKS